MRRREFIAGLGATALPLGARGQQSATKKPMTVIRIGPTNEKSTFDTVFKEEFERLGYTEGQNLIVEQYSTINAQDRPEGFAELARQVVGTQPDVILCYGMPMAKSLKPGTSTIPIVAITADP